VFPFLTHDFPVSVAVLSFDSETETRLRLTLQLKVKWKNKEYFSDFAKGNIVGCQWGFRRIFKEKPEV
jgi:hypothetical protein